MSTPNNEVFNRFLKLIEDDKLCSLLTDEELTYHLEYFLNESLSVYFKKCTKDLTDVEDADFNILTTVATLAQSEFVLDKYPTSPNVSAIKLTFLVNDVEVDYTFNEATMTFTTAPLTGSETVQYGYEFLGQFNENLTDEELWILAHGMILTWNSAKLYAEQKLRNSLSTTDYKTYSPANLLEKLLDLKECSRREMRRLTVSYSFNGFTGFN